jgi:hypothetical protein
LKNYTTFHTFLMQGFFQANNLQTKLAARIVFTPFSRAPETRKHPKRCKRARQQIGERFVFQENERQPSSPTLKRFLENRQILPSCRPAERKSVLELCHRRGYFFPETLPETPCAHFLG